MAKKKEGSDSSTPAPQDANGGGGGTPKWQRMQQPDQPPAPSSDAETPTEAGDLVDGTDTPPDEGIPPEQPETPAKVFTQAEVDAMLGDRLKRERKKFADYNELKAKAAKLDEAERAKLDEVERLKLEAEEARQMAAQAAQRAEEQQISNAILTRLSAFQSEKGQAFRPDATAAALKLVDLSQVEIDKDSGEVGGVDAAIKALATEHPYLLQSPRGAPTTSPTNPARSEPEKGLSNAELRAIYFGGGRGNFFERREEGIIYPE